MRDMIARIPGIPKPLEMEEPMSYVDSVYVMKALWLDVDSVAFIELKLLVQGYLRLLISNLEKLFMQLNVRAFVLPATESSIEMWKGKFGFEEMSSVQVLISL